MLSDEDWKFGEDDCSDEEDSDLEDDLPPQTGNKKSCQFEEVQKSQSRLTAVQKSPIRPTTELPATEGSSSIAVPGTSTIMNTNQDQVIIGIRGRKRPKNENQWAQKKRKLCRNRGESYTTKKNLVVPRKTFDKNLNCHCSRKCPELFKLISDVENVFNSFWRMADFSKQNVFLRGIVQSSKVQRSRTRDGSAVQKSVFHKYFIPVKNGSVRVCKKFFLGAFQISWGRLFRCLRKDEVFTVNDARGRGCSNKIDDSGVVAHIKSFPSYQSHYTRKDNINKKFLHPELNIKKMYNMYVEKCAEEQAQPVKEKFYYSVFSSKFNLHFKVPSKDTCKFCDEIIQKLKIHQQDEKQKRELELEKESHLCKAERARESLKNDKDTVSENKYVCTFDLQKALPFPKLSTSVAYYNRNLYVYNFGIHCFNDSTGYMYVWDETEGGRGSEDLASCIRKHIMTHARTYKKIVLYSDSCTGQNRNIKMALTLLKLCQEPDIQAEQIELKFLVSGHSFLPNDTEFGLIERESKKRQFIYDPNDWYSIINSAKKKSPLFKMTHMERCEFLSTKSLEGHITNRKKDIENKPLNWLKMQWLRFDRDSPFIMKFKETLNENSSFREINLKKREKQGRPLSNIVNVRQDCLYQSRRAVIDKKKEDMLSLLPYIPPVFHSYYRNLPVEVSTRSTTSAIEQVDENNDEIIYV